jgi:hypothetical protein
MKSVKLSLFSALFAILLLIQVVPAWAGAIPKKTPSDYGQSTDQIQLTTPTFNSISQDGVNISLNSVFCTVDNCGGGSPPDPKGQELSYFFAITLGAGSQLDSLQFAPDFNDFGVVIFDGTFTCASGTTCVPMSSSDQLHFDDVGITTTCVSTICTTTFTNFNASTIGIGTIIFAAGTPLDSVLNVNGVPQTPILSASTSTANVSVPEPPAFWFAGIALFACLIGLKKRKAMVAGTAF